MEHFLKLMQLAFALLDKKFTLYGYTFSYLSVIALGLVFSVVCIVISGLLDGGQ